MSNAGRQTVPPPLLLLPLFTGASVTGNSPSLGKTIRVPLRGEGVRPVLTVDPADGLLEMGRVFEGDTVERCPCVVLLLLLLLLLYYYHYSGL